MIVLIGVPAGGGGRFGELVHTGFAPRFDAAFLCSY